MLKPIVRKIYSGIPFKPAMFALVKRAATPPETLYRHLHFTGDFRVAVDREHAFLIRHYGFEVENELFWRGLFTGREGTALRIWVELARNASVIFDVGANSGVYALAAKAVNSKAAVFAFEPIRRVFEKLRVNDELNGFGIECLEVAASNEDGEAAIFDFQGEHSYSSTFHRELFVNDDLVPTTVKTTRLDTLISEMSIERLDLMKIDVEGHEPEVLQGMGSYLDRFRPTMLLEVLTDEAGEKVKTAVAGLGYRYYHIDEDARTIIEVDDLVRRSYYNYLICTEAVANRVTKLLSISS
jgi:FkbM family methyltransferase